MNADRILSDKLAVLAPWLCEVAAGRVNLLDENMQFAMSEAAVLVKEASDLIHSLPLREAPIPVVARPPVQPWPDCIMPVIAIGHGTSFFKRSAR